MNRKEDTVFCYYAHNSVWTCELGYGADSMFHRTYFLLVIILANVDRFSKFFHCQILKDLLHIYFMRFSTAP